MKGRFADPNSPCSQPAEIHGCSWLGMHAWQISVSKYTPNVW